MHRFNEKAPKQEHTEKYFRNLIESTQNQIVVTIFRLIWIQTDVHLDPNQSVNGNYNLISGLFKKISEIFPCVRGGNAYRVLGTDESILYACRSYVQDNQFASISTWLKNMNTQ